MSRPATAPTIHSSAVDPLTREVILAAIKAITYEMEGVIGRASMSPGFRDKKDYFIGLFSAEGDMFHALMAYSGAGMVRPILKHYPAADMRNGDLYFFNDPYSSDGAVQHLPDSVLASPIVVDGRTIGLAAAFGHVEDVGGLAGKSSSAHVRDVWHEGVAYPPIHVGRSWGFDDWFTRLFERNTRAPAMVTGDLAALMSACKLGVTRFGELCDRYGVSTVLGALRWEIQNTREQAKEILRTRLTSGVYEVEEQVRIAHLDEPRVVRLTMTVDVDEISFDLSRSDDQVPVQMNYVCSKDGLALLLAMKMLVFSADLPMNEGILSLVEKVTLREGSIVSPRFPAPILMRSQVKTAVANCVGMALALASSGYMSAPQPSYAVAEFEFPGISFTETFGVGLGGRPFGDGPDVIYAPAQRNYPIESVEARYSVEILTYAICTDSAGAGQYRGGCGVVRRIKVLEDCTFSMQMSNSDFGSPGVNGGRAGSVARVQVERATGEAEVHSGLTSGVRLFAGDIVEVSTAGGGGWGMPGDRPRDAVSRDVRDGFVSADQAQAVYGVSVSEDAEHRI